MAAEILIDAHTHTQPTPEAGRAFVRQWSAGGDREGTVDELLRSMDAAGITRTLIVPWLPAQDMVAEQVSTGADRDAAVAAVTDEWRELNRWAAEAVTKNPDRLACLVGVDPVLMPVELIEAEVAERLATGACGLKIAPMFIRARPDDEVMEVVWRCARDHAVFVLSESGALSLDGGTGWGHPAHFDAVLRSYPTVTVQLAHLGQGAERDVAVLTGRYPNVVTDTSLRLDLEPPAHTADLIRRIGPDRVLFGTNYPLVDQGAYAAALRALPLTDDELELVGRANAARLLGD
ncbi:MAG TPA: amidohydrolase family protein [Acidimicrobiales bacterium]